MKTHIRNLFIFLVPTILLASCAQPPLQKQLLTGDIPQFQGYISPISAPIQPVIAPVEAESVATVAMVFNVTEGSTTSKINKCYKTTIKYQIKREDDSLVWSFAEWKVYELKPGDRSVLLYQFPADYRAYRVIMDKFGEIQEIESPRSQFDETISAESMALAEAALPETPLKESSLIFSRGPVVSGDSIFEQCQTTIGEMIPAFSESVDAETDIDIDYIIKGWSYFNGKKVIVTAIDEVVNAVIEDELELQLKINGYKLFDIETYQVIDGYCLAVINSTPSSGIKFSGRILTHDSARLD